MLKEILLFIMCRKQKELQTSLEQTSALTIELNDAINTHQKLSKELKQKDQEIKSIQKAKENLEQEKQGTEARANVLYEEKERAVSLVKQHEQKGLEISHTSQQEMTKLSNELRQKTETIERLNSSLVQERSTSNAIRQKFEKQMQDTNERLVAAIDTKEAQIEKISKEKASMAQALQISQKALQQMSLELKKAFLKFTEDLKAMNTRTHSLTKQLDHLQNIQGRHILLVKGDMRQKQTDLSTLMEQSHQEMAQHSTTRREKEALEQKLHEAQEQNHVLSKKQKELSEHVDLLKEVHTCRSAHYHVVDIIMLNK